MGSIRADITGRKFGRLTAIRYDHTRGGKRAYWLFRCDCGTESVRRGGSVTASHNPVRSCGCLTREATARTKTTHGQSKTPEYNRWRAMLSRCTNPKDLRWADYGGRGITVCDRWRTYEGFLADMGQCPPGHSLERVDVDGPYAPENCTWIPLAQQAANKRRTIWVEVSGERMPLRQYAMREGVSYDALYSAHSRYGTDPVVAAARLRAKV